MRQRISGEAGSGQARAFRHSPAAVASACTIILMVGAAIFAPWLAPHDPTDLASISLMDNLKPPIGMADGEWDHPLGTDNQGRDMLSAILYGLRTSLAVSVSAIGIALSIGILLGLVAGYAEGVVGAALMRLADVQLTFPAILMALLIDGVIRSALPPGARDGLQLYVVIFSIAISVWPGIARTVRGSTLTERGKDYVAAAQLIGVPAWRIMATHLLPNVLGPVLVLGTLGLGLAIVVEATLSFLGVGLPPTQPSLGTLIRSGGDYLFSGQWWITVFPGSALVVFVLTVNLLGDWLRDVLNPGLR